MKFARLVQILVRWRIGIPACLLGLVCAWYFGGAARAQDTATQPAEDRLKQSGALFTAAQIARHLGQEPRQSIRLYERALELRESVVGSSHPDLLEILRALGGAHDKFGDSSRGLPYLLRALEISEKTYDPHHREVGTDLANLAGVRANMQEYATAVRLFERALDIVEKSGPEKLLAYHLNVLAAMYTAAGEYQKAVPLYRRTLALLEKVYGFEHAQVAIPLHNLGIQHALLGDYAAASGYFTRSLAIRENAAGPDSAVVAGALASMAGLYRLMGEYRRAIPLVQHSLAIREKQKDTEPGDVASSLGILGDLHSLAGDHALAASVLEESLAIYERGRPGHTNIGNNLHRLGSVYLAMGEARKALPLVQRGLAILEKVLGPEHPWLAEVLNTLADLNIAQGDRAAALSLLRRSLAIATQHPVPEKLWQTQNRLRALHAAQQQMDLAIFFGKQAINTIQEMRSQLITLDREIQQSFLENKAHAYRGLAELLIAEGRLPEAQQVLAMLKEEEFFEYIRRSPAEDRRKTTASYVGLEVRFEARFRELRQSTSAVTGEVEALERRAKLGLDESEKQRLTQLRAQRAAQLAQVDAFIKDLMREMGASRPAAAAAPAGATEHLAALREMLSALGGGAVLLHYLVLEDRIHVILTTGSSQVVREAKLGAAELNRRIHAYRQVLQDPRRDPLPAAKELYGLLVGPVAADLAQINAQTLMLALDGTLRYLPFAALHDGERYLAERYRLALYTEAVRERLREAPIAGWQITGMGVTRQHEGFSPLPAVKEELEGIVTKAGLPGDVHLDEAFTAELLGKGLGMKRPVVHIASHFVFQPGTDANSFLLLGDGNRLSLAQLKRYSFEGIDLITLSACDTALGGGRDANGREIEGFGALAQRQGARGVLATLWPVADASTGILMQNLYRLRGSQGKMTKAEALQQAQLALLAGRHEPQAAAASAKATAQRGIARPDDKFAQFTRDPKAPYAHPFYWAPFILMGNWL